MSDARVDEIYAQLKQMAVGFRLRPGDRLNEGALARELGVSRTPLREALNRLVAENFFTFRPGSGFFCRDLDVKTIYDLFEMRQVIEVAAVRYACERATDTDLKSAFDDLISTGMEVDGLTIAEACRRDEDFHIRIAKLSDNMALLNTLQHINERIRFIRWVSITTELARKSKLEHHAIMKSLIERDANAATAAMETHIEKRKDQVHEAVRHGVANIYMNMADGLSEQLVGDIVA